MGPRFQFHCKKHYSYYSGDAREGHMEEYNHTNPGTVKAVQGKKTTIPVVKKGEQPLKLRSKKEEKRVHKKGHSRVGKAHVQTQELRVKSNQQPTMMILLLPCLIVY